VDFVILRGILAKVFWVVGSCLMAFTLFDILGMLDGQHGLNWSSQYRWNGNVAFVIAAEA
jgi:hypothetical protein